MNIINKTVRHKTFGEGKVCEVNESFVSVQFGSRVRKFIFPDAFREYLILVENQSRKYVDEMLTEMDEVLKLKKEKEQREMESKRLLRSLPLNENAQVAFGFFYNDKQKVLEDFAVTTGISRSGQSRGKPRIPSRVYPNSACLLTFRERNEREEKRYIWGVFMAGEDFIGSQCSDGIIYAHEKYRIILTEEERENFEFWKYFADASRDSKKWGLAEFRYFSNATMALILNDIHKVKQGTDEQQLCEDFLNYFCSLNRIDKSRSLSDLRIG
jgi:hypothetical protein